MDQLSVFLFCFLIDLSGFHKPPSRVDHPLICCPGLFLVFPVWKEHLFAPAVFEIRILIVLFHSIHMLNSQHLIEPFVARSLQLGRCSIDLTLCLPPKGVKLLTMKQQSGYHKPHFRVDHRFHLTTFALTTFARWPATACCPFLPRFAPGAFFFFFGSLLICSFPLHSNLNFPAPDPVLCSKEPVLKPCLHRPELYCLKR